MHRFTLLLALLPHAADAKCAWSIAVPDILTTRDTKLPDDGGILVGWKQETGDIEDGRGQADPSDAQGWTATAGKTKVALTRTSLAPGLSVFKPDKFTGTLAVTSQAGELGKFTRDGSGANKMPAPEVTKDVVSTTKGARWTDRHAVVTLKSAPPPEAMVLITFKGSTPITFVRLSDTHDDVKTIETFEDRGHCGLVVDGSSPPAAGDKVTFAWVDAFGRVSPHSAAVVVK